MFQNLNCNTIIFHP